MVQGQRVIGLGKLPVHGFHLPWLHPLAVVTHPQNQPLPHFPGADHNEALRVRRLAGEAVLKGIFHNGLEQKPGNGQV